MKSKPSFSNLFEGLSDEDILKAFTERFNCDGALLIYLENDNENGLARWANKNGKKWVNAIMPVIKQKHLNKNI
ncbi:hypothetical protein [Chryseobacterium glaciei]|nr:hypothetical protein [Chryseobacterium glaciei]